MEEDHHYSLMRNQDGSEHDVEIGDTRWEKAKPISKDDSKGLSRHIVVVLCFIAASTVSFYAGMHIKIDGRYDAECAKHTSEWSPILQDVGVTYSTIPFEGAFMRENIYRKNGSPEVDAAWEALGVDYRAGVISREDGLKSGLNDSFVQRADKYGGGFFVNVEGLHHLHCLNLVRKALYFNYDYYKNLGMHAFKNDENVLRLHVTHCLDTIRQVLMCNVDTGMLGQVWVYPDEPTAFPDFETRHTCKNYDEIRKWAEKLQAPPPDDAPEDILAPPIGQIKSSIP